MINTYISRTVIRELQYEYVTRIAMLFLNRALNLFVRLDDIVCKALTLYSVYKLSFIVCARKSVHSILLTTAYVKRSADVICILYKHCLWQC